MVNKIKTHEDHTDEERKKEEYTNRIFLNRETIEGRIDKVKDNNKTFNFFPDNKKIRIIRILYPKGKNKISKSILDVERFINNPKEFRKNKYVAKIIDWNPKKYKNPLGELVECKKVIDSKYEKYYSKEIIEKEKNNGKYYKGQLMIDEKYRSENNYVLVNDSDKVYIKSEIELNRGLDGDEVVIELTKNNKSKEKRGKIIILKILPIKIRKLKENYNFMKTMMI